MYAFGAIPLSLAYFMSWLGKFVRYPSLFFTEGQGEKLNKNNMKQRIVDMSTPSTPITPEDSADAHAERKESTQPSSPVEDDPTDQPDKEMETENGESEKSEAKDDDTEGMDMKAKALMHLLKTSSVCGPASIIFFFFFWALQLMALIFLYD